MHFIPNNKKREEASVYIDLIAKITPNPCLHSILECGFSSSGLEFKYKADSWRQCISISLFSFRCENILSFFS